MKLGRFLKACDYTGLDAPLPDTPARLSTTCASAMEGWLLLYGLEKHDEFREEAIRCAELLMAEQTEQGMWLSPFPFRRNPPSHPYACENFLTLRPLIHFYDRMGRETGGHRVRLAVERGLQGLVAHIGYRADGCFWYSPTDQIEVPNISSMAAATFAEACQVLHLDHLAAPARLCAAYCVRQQRPDGGYRYFSDQEFVYVPYHALEIWELGDANQVLREQELEQSLQRAVHFMDRYLELRSYRSRDDERGRRSKLLFKTPVWMARAYLSRGRHEKAWAHLDRGMRMFGMPGGDSYYYYLREKRTLGWLRRRRPDLGSVYMRYNASCFETGCRLLAVLGGALDRGL
ncbi:MAG: hypothetical protein AB1640_20630 [bacterium]